MEIKKNRNLPIGHHHAWFPVHKLQLIFYLNDQVLVVNLYKLNELQLLVEIMVYQ
jgi:hypothetical protein